MTSPGRTEDDQLLLRKFLEVPRYSHHLPPYREEKEKARFCYSHCHFSIITINDLRKEM